MTRPINFTEIKAQFNNNMAQRQADLNKCNIAIWGESVSKDYKLKDGDRVEICRQLNLDAKTLRRQRARGGIKRDRR